MIKLKVCPKCGNKTFFVPSQVVQTWEVGTDGTLLEVVKDSDRVISGPDEGDIWTCANKKCGYRNFGFKFNVE